MKCAVPGCSSTTRKPRRNSGKRGKMSFHRLPWNEALTIKWKKILNLDINLHESNDNVRICGSHFDKNCFLQNTKTLRLDSVPRPFMNHQVAAAQQQNEDEDMSSDDDWMDIDDAPAPLVPRAPPVLRARVPPVVPPVQQQRVSLCDLLGVPHPPPKSQMKKEDPPIKPIPIDTSSGSDSSYYGETDYDDQSDLSESGYEFAYLLDLLVAEQEMEEGSEDRASSVENETNVSLSDYSDDDDAGSVAPLTAKFPSEPPKVPQQMVKISPDLENNINENNIVAPGLKPAICVKDLINELETLRLFDGGWFEKLAVMDVETPLPQYSPDSKDYNDDMKLFAVYLNYYSTAAYAHAEERYGVVPPVPILAEWYMSTNFKPGFCKEAFDAIAAAQKASPEQLHIHILYDEMRVKYNKYTCDEDDYINVGPGKLDMDCDFARRACVFMATCVTKRWKIPLGFLACCHGQDDDVVPNLIEICIRLLLKTGVKVVGITMPLGLYDTQKNFAALGCKFEFTDIKTNFSILNENLVFVPDSAEVLELIRYNFRKRGVFVNADGNDIDWMYLDKLIKIQEANDTDAETLAVQAYLTREKINARLAVFTLDSCVADVLMYFQDVLKLPEFMGASATAEFVRTIGTSMEILNGRGDRKIFCAENIEEIKTFIAQVCPYICALRTERGKRIVKISDNHGFMGLMFGLKSLLNIYTNLVEQGKLSYVRLDSFTKDPLELMLQICRSNVPFVAMSKFVKGYKRLCSTDRTWLTKDKVTGQMVPADGISTLHLRNNNATKVINYSDRYFTSSEKSGKFPKEESPTEEFWNTFEVLLRLPKLSEYKQDAMRNLGGFIAHLLRNRLKCLHCVAALMGSQHGYLIRWKKKVQVIKYPNANVLQICWLTERMINIHGVTEENSRKICTYVMREMEDFFTSRDTSHDIQHRLLLVRAVCEMYCDIRRYYEEKAGGKDNNVNTKRMIVKNVKTIFQ